MGWRQLLLLLLLGYLVMVADSCPMVDTVDPSSGSTDSSFTYTLAGGDFGSNISLTSTAGLLNYTVLSDSLIRFSFQQGSSARGSVYVTVEPSAIGCSAVNITVFITVPFPPILEAVDETVLLYRSNVSHSIRCSILGSTEAPAWYYNNIPISTRSGRTILTNKILFDPFTASHSGWYTCVASNKYGRTERDYLVVATTAPALTVSPNPMNNSLTFYQVQSGSTVVLPCFGSGVPLPNVTWFLNGDLILLGSNGFDIEPTSSALVITNFTMQQALVSCSVRNALGNVESGNVTLRLSTPADLTTSPLESSYIISNTSTATLQCYQATPPNGTIFQWFKNYDLLTEAQNKTLVVSGSSNGEQWGHYCCRMIDGSSSKVLDVRCTVVIVRLPGKLLQSPPASVSLPSGRTVGLLCSAGTENGIDVPALTWSRNNITIAMNTPRYSVQPQQDGIAALIVSDAVVTDTGHYQCSGVNSAGSVSASTMIRVIETCNGSNLLTNSGAEVPREDLNQVDINGERIFQVNGSSTVMFEQLTIARGTMLMHFSSRMRTDTTRSLPVITLTVTGETSINITLPFPSSTAWQWVEHRTELNIANTSAQLLVEISNTGAGQDSTPVYFDDLCLSLSDVSVFITTVSVPITTASISITATPIPITTASIPITTTPTPITAESIPITTTSISITTASIPITTTSISITDVSIPITTASILITTLSVPTQSSVLLMPVSTSLEPAVTTPPDMQEDLTTVKIILAISLSVGGALAVLAVIAVCLLTCSCVFGSKRTRRREKIFKEFNVELNKGNVEAIALANLNSDPSSPPPHNDVLRPSITSSDTVLSTKDALTDATPPDTKATVLPTKDALTDATPPDTKTTLLPTKDTLTDATPPGTKPVAIKSGSSASLFSSSHTAPPSLPLPATPPNTPPPISPSAADYLEITNICSIPKTSAPLSSTPVPSSIEPGYVAICPLARDSSHLYSLPDEGQYSYVSTSELDRLGSQRALVTPANDDEENVYY